MAQSTTIGADGIAETLPLVQDPHAAFRVIDPRLTLALIRQAADEIRGFQGWRAVIQQRASGLFRRVYEERTHKDATIRALESDLSGLDRRNADLERALAEISSDYERVVMRCMEAEFRVIQAEHRAFLAERSVFRLEDLLDRIGDRPGITDQD
ncbi:hypothetical protein MKK75_25025 [Methylobacterium sp. J-030]|uniref:hypothetical protein n=1 Tax=Methylobacterium sp. J-030 TaxID=2836627 RepID=UPI001FB926B5|nr:hypothetical protein [Methylobacterium sp. J-030]MCJ2072025.1 hypothetical protein [Methylobacterium sp. J-030]